MPWYRKLLPYPRSPRQTFKHRLDGWIVGGAFLFVGLRLGPLVYGWDWWTVISSGVYLYIGVVFAIEGMAPEDDPTHRPTK